MNNIFLILQAATSIVLIVLVLLQQGGSGLGSAFGQEGGTYATKRGVQKKIFWGIIALGFLFVLLSILNLFL